jgi:hypothetical protein
MLKAIKVSCALLGWSESLCISDVSFYELINTSPAIHSREGLKAKDCSLKVTTKPNHLFGNYI